jgi:hypothetical protein
MPPQGLLLIANYLPESWSVRFVDENMTRATAADFTWANVVFVTGDANYRTCPGTGIAVRSALGQRPQRPNCAGATFVVRQQPEQFSSVPGAWLQVPDELCSPD